MAKKVPTLRRGLTVADLRKGCWINEPNRYTTDYELTFTDDVVNLALQRLIDAANNGERVHRKAVSETLCGIGQMLTSLKDTINERLRSGELTPSILERIAEEV